MQQLPEEIQCADSLIIFRRLQNSEATIQRPLTTAKEFNIQSALENPVNPFQLLNEKTPEKRKVEAAAGERNPPKCRKRLTFKLEDVYERVYGEKPGTSHAAEADVLALLLSAIATPVEFLNAIECDAIPLTNITKCW